MHMSLFQRLCRPVSLRLAVCAAAIASAATVATATETENLNIRILPAPASMTIDGKANDWDLSGGIFICGDVENLRDQMACGSTPCTTPTIFMCSRGGSTKRP
ncbi:MAG: hypothetical protein HQ464_11340 [Planctomycetes bacterium]|nr:hypothetical protein [Planctomycetota bacterium]